MGSQLTGDRMITASADAALPGTKERKVWLLGDPDNLLEVVTRPSGNAPQLALICVSAQAHAASAKGASKTQNGVEDPIMQSRGQGFAYKAA